jgi:hypothetical protein
VIYEFVNVTTGEARDFFYLMNEAPKIGEIVDHQGQDYRRVVNFQMDAGMEAKVHGYPYLSSSLPRNLKGCETNRQGKPIITSRNHERDVMDRHGYNRD